MSKVKLNGHRRQALLIRAMGVAPSRMNVQQDLFNVTRDSLHVTTVHLVSVAQLQDWQIPTKTAPMGHSVLLGPVLTAKSVHLVHTRTTQMQLHLMIALTVPLDCIVITLAVVPGWRRRKIQLTVLQDIIVWKGHLLTIPIRAQQAHLVSKLI